MDPLAGNRIQVFAYDTMCHFNEEEKEEENVTVKQLLILGKIEFSKN